MPTNRTHKSTGIRLVFFDIHHNSSVRCDKIWWRYTELAMQTDPMCFARSSAALLQPPRTLLDDLTLLSTPMFFVQLGIQSKTYGIATRLSYLQHLERKASWGWCTRSGLFTWLGCIYHIKYFCYRGGLPSGIPSLSAQTPSNFTVQWTYLVKVQEFDIFHI